MARLLSGTAASSLSPSVYRTALAEAAETGVVSREAFSGFDALGGAEGEYERVDILAVGLTPSGVLLVLADKAAVEQLQEAADGVAYPEFRGKMVSLVIGQAEADAIVYAKLARGGEDADGFGGLAQRESSSSSSSSGGGDGGSGSGSAGSDGNGDPVDPFAADQDERGGLNTPRPHAAQTLSRVVSALGAELERVCITGQIAGTYYATIGVKFKSKRGARVERSAVDARPSDAIAFAIASGAPLYARKSVLRETTLGDAMRESAIRDLLGEPAQPEPEGEAEAGATERAKAGGVEDESEAAPAAGSESKSDGVSGARGRKELAQGGAVERADGTSTSGDEQKEDSKRQRMKRAVAIEMARAAKLSA